MTSVGGVLRVGHVGLLILGLLMTGPGCDEDTELEEGEFSEIRFAHLSPDAGDVDYWIGNRALALNVLYTETSEFEDILDGQFDLAAVPAGGDPGTSLIQDEVNVGNRATYTYVLFGVESSPRSLFLEDDHEGLEDGDIRLRLLHTAPNYGAVDFYEVSEPEDPFLLGREIGFGEQGAPITWDSRTIALGLDVDRDGTVDLGFHPDEMISSETYVNVFVGEEEGELFLLLLTSDARRDVLFPSGP